MISCEYLSSPFAGGVSDSSDAPLFSILSCFSILSHKKKADNCPPPLHFNYFYPNDTYRHSDSRRSFRRSCMIFLTFSPYTLNEQQEKLQILQLSKQSMSENSFCTFFLKYRHRPSTLYAYLIRQKPF